MLFKALPLRLIPSKAFEKGIQGVPHTPSLDFPLECLYIAVSQNPIPFLRARSLHLGSNPIKPIGSHIHTQRHESIRGDTWGESGDQQKGEGVRRGNGDDYDQIISFTCMKVSREAHYYI